VRYLPTGTPDNTFDGDGIRTIDLHGQVSDMTLQSNKIILVGIIL